MRAIFLDAATFGDGFDFSVLKDLPCEWIFYPKTVGEARERIRDADIVLTNKVILGRKELQETKAKLIAITATGYNNVDMQAAKELGITVCNVPAYSTPSVVQHIFTLILALSSNLLLYAGDTRSGKWQKSPMFTILDYPIHEIAQKKLGIIGYGAQGKEVEQIAKALGMQVVIAKHNDPSKPIPGAIDLHQMLGESDFLVITVPLTPKTRNLITAKELHLMKPTAFLINTARGGIVNEQDLANALKQRVIAGAGIDVLSEEPPKPDNPLLQKDVPHILITPHIAWASIEARRRCLAITKSNIAAFLRGAPRNTINA